MKRILFYTDNFSGEASRGGTEVATFRIASALKDTGEFKVFNAYRKRRTEDMLSTYEASVSLPASSGGFQKVLSDFIAREEIDVVVNMTRFFRHHDIVKSVKKSGRQVKVIFMQHFAPGSEFKKTTFSAGLHLLKLNPSNPLYWLRASLYPLIKYPRNLSLPGVYAYTYENSDKVVLLSPSYVPDYCRIGGLSDTSKFVAIPNIFERPREISASSPILPEKEKRVLIMSRLDEIQKRLSSALKIWKKIEGDADLSDWHLDIVGSGHNADIVRKLVKKYGLQNVTIHGWKPREEFLKKASILMMTSDYEGLPLSILEAMAYGVVPIAFNSFSSLKDMVEEFKTGVIVNRNGDIDEFTKKLSELMYDRIYRNELSTNGMLSGDKFTAKSVVEKWRKILI